MLRALTRRASALAVAGLMATSGAIAAEPASAAKKELVQKVLKLQQPGIEAMARSLAERPALQMLQAAGMALQTQVPADKRESVGKAVEADIKKFVDEAAPLLRERAVKLAPAVLGPTLEEKFSEDELKQLIAWLESPVNKKYQQLAPEMQNSMAQRLANESRAQIEPKLQALEKRVRAAVGAPAAAASR